MRSKRTILQVFTIIFVGLLLAGWSNNEAESSAGLNRAAIEEENSSLGVSPEEVAKASNLEKRLQERYRSTGEGNFTTGKDLDQMLRSYARSQYLPKDQSGNRVAAGDRCGEVTYERLSYEVGASFMRKFVTQNSTGGASLLPKLAVSDTNLPLFIQAKVDVGNQSIPMLVVLNGLRDQSRGPIILDFIQAGLVESSSNVGNVGSKPGPQEKVDANQPLLFSVPNVDHGLFPLPKL